MKNIIANNFQHGDDFRHGHNIIIEPDVIVGNNVTIGNNVVLMSGTRFGNNVIFADYCCTTGACILGNNINIRTNSTISKCVIIEDNVFIGGGVMTSHTKHVPHCRPKIPKTQYLMRIGYGSIIGSHSILLAGACTAQNTIIGGGSVVVRSTTKSGIYVGNPIRRLGDVPENYWVEGKSKHYYFNPQILKKYLPNLILNADPHKKIAKG